LQAEEKIYDSDLLSVTTVQGDNLYAAVLLDVQIKGLKDRLFTYRVPESLMGSAFVGAQVLVPFGGRQLLAGYIVGLSGSHNLDKSPKDIQEVVEPEPLFDGAYIDFLAYVAKKYCASLQEVIAAAIPACLTTRLKRVVKLAQDYSCLKDLDPMERNLALASVLAPCKDDLAIKIIVDLILQSAKSTLSISTLRQRFEREGRLHKPKLNLSHFQRALSKLTSASLVLIETEQEGATEAKTKKVLRLGEEPAQTEKQKLVLQALIDHHGLADDGGQSDSSTRSIAYLTPGQLAEKTKISRSTIEKMVSLNMLTAIEEGVVRDGLAGLPQSFIDIDKQKLEPALTEEQKHVFGVLEAELQKTIALGPANEPIEPWLLHGVTGSGKTEIYLRLISDVLKLGRTALFLVPEISLTPQLAGRLKGRFGKLVAVWHSAISAGERYDTFQRLRSGDVKVLLGARSAILAHIPDLGLIILDEEHDGSYKQTSPAPRYHARNLALEKARRAGAMVLLGSATPDLVSYYQADLAGRVLSMPSRVFQQAMPKVTIVDMRKQFKDGYKTAFSEPLNWAVRDRLAKAEQVVLLINRRGYASHVFCQVCGHVVKCKNCSVSLVLHQKGHRAEGEALTKSAYLACHHCGYRTALMPSCTACDSPFLKESGLGTQKVEMDVHKLFPEARVVRLDSDVAAIKGAYEKVLAEFAEGRADILIGTQMVAKGLDIEKVTLVGVLTADAAFNLPDYRSMERGFQLLTQVSGRAGRGAHPGEVILQTYAPDLEALRLASHHDFKGFFAPELASRRLFQYPPFSQLIRVVVSSEDSDLAESVSEWLAEEISRLIEDEVDEEEVRILGPTACLLEKVKTKYRFHLLVKNMAGARVQYMITDYLRLRRFGNDVNVAVDVDALDLI
jgi:primosomal protein N' (replication factor Y)